MSDELRSQRRIGLGVEKSGLWVNHGSIGLTANW